MRPLTVGFVVAAGTVVVGAIYLYVQVSAAPVDVAPPVAATKPPVSAKREDKSVVAPSPSPNREAAVRKGLPSAGGPAASSNSGLGPGPSLVEAPRPSLRESVTDQLANDEVMAEANRAYDRQDYDEAIKIAQRVLASDPDNVRMLRVVVSSACVMGDFDVGNAAFARLPTFDQSQMNRRCLDRTGMQFSMRASKQGDGADEIRPKKP